MGRSDLAAAEPVPLDLVQRARGGDDDALRLLVERCHPLVVRIARAHRGRDVAEEDLVQEVFVTVLAHLDAYRPIAGIRFEAWLARVAANRCRDLLRAASRRPRTVGIDASPAAAEWLDALLGGRAPAVEDALGARDLVDRLLAEVPPRDRALLTLLDGEERPTAEVAALLGMSRTAVKVAAFRARLRVRAAARRLREAP